MAERGEAGCKREKGNELLLECSVICKHCVCECPNDESARVDLFYCVDSWRKSASLLMMRSSVFHPAQSTSETQGSARAGAPRILFIADMYPTKPGMAKRMKRMLLFHPQNPCITVAFMSVLVT